MFPSIKNKFTVRCMNVIIIDGGKCFTVENDMRLWVVSPNMLFDLDLKSYSINLTNTCIPKREDWRPLWSYVQGNHNTCRLIFSLIYLISTTRFLIELGPPLSPAVCTPSNQRLVECWWILWRTRILVKNPFSFFLSFFLSISCKFGKFLFMIFKLVSLRTDIWIFKKKKSSI